MRKSRILLTAFALMLSCTMLSGCNKNKENNTEEATTESSAINWKKEAEIKKGIMIKETWINSSGGLYTFSADETYESKVEDKVHKGKYWFENNGRRLVLCMQEDEMPAPVEYEVIMMADNQINLMNASGDVIMWEVAPPATDDSGNTINFEAFKDELAKLTATSWRDPSNASVYTFSEDGTFIDEFMGQNFDGTFWFSRENDVITLYMQENMSSEPVVYTIVEFYEDISMTVLDNTEYEIVWMSTNVSEEDMTAPGEDNEDGDVVEGENPPKQEDTEEDTEEKTEEETEEEDSV